MSKLYPKDHFVTTAEIRIATPPKPVRRGRTFDLHPALFLITFGSFLTYVGVMAAIFATREMIIPAAIFTITIAAGFVVPAMWARVESPKVGRLPDWSDFKHSGIDTWSGHVSASSATIQVLIMPAMLLLWAIAIAVIRASV